MDKNSIAEEIYDAFHSTMQEIESLEEFYHRSLKTVDEYNQQVEADCGIGIKIGNLFNSVLDLKGVDKKNQRISEISEEKINETIKLKDICDIVEYEEDSNALQFSMHKVYLTDYRYSPLEAQRKKSNVLKYRKILVESVISHIIVIYENFLSYIYRLLISKEPIRYVKEQTVQIADLIKYQNDAIIAKLEQIVENGLRDSLGLLETIIKNESIVIDRYESILIDFSEVYYRRNAYIHTRGCANRDYINKADKKFTKNIKEGQPFINNKAYLENAIILLIKIIFSITLELLQNEKEAGEYINAVAEYMFTRLCDKQYVISRFAYNALSQCKALQFEERSMYRINYINACKQMGDSDTFNDEMKLLDVSAMKDKFVIAKHCLANETDKVYALLNKTYPDSFDAMSIRDWPIFINFRETEEYRKFYEAHKEDFALQEMLANKQNDGGCEKTTLNADNKLTSLKAKKNKHQKKGKLKITKKYKK